MTQQAPSFYDPAKVGTLFKPDLGAVTKDAELSGLPPANEDKNPAAMILVDFQIDFCHTDGSLSVPGAVDDLRRTCDFIYKNAEKIKTLIISLDCHLPHQIFYSTWWVDSNGKPPPPHTVIDTAAINAGKFKPVIDPVWSIDYVKKLETQAQKPLYIWPFHTMIGSIGQALDPSLAAAIHWHSVARHTQPVYLQKGNIPKTEHYSPFEPEVKVPEHPLGNLQVPYLTQIEKHNRTFVAGEAKSHCVLAAGASMVKHFSARPDVIERIHFLGDCMSSVVVPGIDFEAMAEAEISTWKQKGLKVIQSTASI
jgi:nicotinamidase/pyrazinamidase